MKYIVVIPFTIQTSHGDIFLPLGRILRLTQEQVARIGDKIRSSVENAGDFYALKGRLPEPHRQCFCCKKTDYWLAGTDINLHWVCRRCHPPAPGAERLRPIKIGNTGQGE